MTFFLLFLEGNLVEKVSFLARYKMTNITKNPMFADHHVEKKTLPFNSRITVLRGEVGEVFGNHQPIFFSTVKLIS